jgi:hypothetical protein
LDSTFPRHTQADDDLRINTLTTPRSRHVHNGTDTCDAIPEHGSGSVSQQPKRAPCSTRHGRKATDGHRLSSRFGNTPLGDHAVRSSSDIPPHLLVSVSALLNFAVIASLMMVMYRSLGTARRMFAVLPGRQPHRLKCRVCGSANVTPTGRRNHLGRETHHCDDCGAQFPDDTGNA